MTTYAHRGYSSKENSYQSFLNSFDYFDGIEFDVRLTRDNIPIVIHDYNLSKTHKSNKIIHLTDYQDLKDFKLPLLIDALKLVEKNNKQCLIDIKVINNSNFIINYLTKLIDLKLIDPDRFCCTVYTDDINFWPQIKMIRAYNKIIPNIVNKNFYGVTVKFNGTKINFDSIIKYLQNSRHLNLCVLKSDTTELKNILSQLKNKFYNQISFTLDKKIDF